MAKLVKTTIHINGTEVKQFHQFSLNQGIFAHHTFKLVCPSEVLDDIKSTPLSKSKNLIGTSFKIKIENFDGTNEPLQFMGLVTQVEATKYNGHSGDVIVTGYSPTILMDNSPHCKSWEDKTLNAIAKDVFDVFAQNLLSSNLKAAYSTPIPYTVQYKETAWQFVNRLAATYGEWIFYNGERVALGPLESKTAQLTYGSNLSSLSMAMQLRPGSFAQVAYDAVTTTTYEASPQGIQGEAGLNDLGTHSYNKSNEFFNVASKVYIASPVSDQEQLNKITNTRAAAQASNLVRFNGASTHFGVQLGNSVSVDNNHGSYTIIEVNHTCNGIGNYSNEFIAIPETIKVPPVTNYAEPHSEAQSAVVTDNFDDQGMGRIRVRFKWMNDNEKTPWIRMMMPHAGGGKGAFFIPEKDEEVIVAFENNNPTKPYVQGTLYNSSQSNGFSNAGNDIKTIETRSGTKLRMNDAEGSVFVEDPSGNTWFMDGKGNISVNAPGNINMTAGLNINMTAGINIASSAGMNMVDNAGVMISQTAGADYRLMAENIFKTAIENITTEASSALKNATNNITIQSIEGSVFQHAQQRINNNAGNHSKSY